MTKARKNPVPDIFKVAREYFVSQDPQTLEKFQALVRQLSETYGVDPAPYLKKAEDDYFYFIPEIIRDATARYKQEGNRGVDWTWFQVMSGPMKDRFEEYLVYIKHPSAYEAGSPENRFRNYIREQAEGKKNPIKKQSIPGLDDWNMFAGGTSAPPNTHSYSIIAPDGKKFFISPMPTPRGKLDYYLLQVFPGFNVAGYESLGSFPRAASAAKFAREYYDAQGGQVNPSLGDLVAKKAGQMKSHSKPVPTKDPETMTPGQLEKEMEKNRERSSALLTRMIAMGRGEEKFDETAKRTDPVSVEYVGLARRLYDLRQAAERRRLGYPRQAGRNPQGLKDIGYNHYMISAKAAGQLARASSYGKLPGPGREVLVKYLDKYYWLRRDRYQGRNVWVIHGPTEWRPEGRGAVLGKNPPITYKGYKIHQVDKNLFEVMESAHPKEFIGSARTLGDAKRKVDLMTRTKGILKNPKMTKIYNSVIEIKASKAGMKHKCDAACKRSGHKYIHKFKNKACIYGLPDGSILIK